MSSVIRQLRMMVVCRSDILASPMSCRPLLRQLLIRSINCCSPKVIYLKGIGNRILSKETNINYKRINLKIHIDIHMIWPIQIKSNKAPSNHQYNQDIYMAENNQAPTADTTSPSAPLQTHIQPVVDQKVETQSIQQSFTDFRTQIADLKNWTNDQCKELKGWDERLARNITDLKKDYILSIGGLMNRSICMAVASGLTYKLVSSNTASLFARTRNLGASFVINGWLFLPELFNPFLKHQ